VLTRAQSYLDAQTETVVFTVQRVLAGVRAAGAPSAALAEDVTRVITAVASVAAVCADALPPASAVRGRALLATLEEQAERLSEALARAPQLDKADRQTVARSSLAVANAMRDLVKL
jgi:hypothetical protein